MKERNIIILLSVFFLFTGIFVAASTIYSSDFNFNKAELTLTNQNINEKLYYTPDQDYHTLYRTFSSIIYMEPTEFKNNILIKDVKCSEGTPYARAKWGVCYAFPDLKKTDCLAYTEPNEYGCSFGDTYGFKSNNNYQIESSYILHPENLFLIKNNYYIKFIAYSKNQHAYFDSSNLIINGDAVADTEYYPRNEVIIYIPFNNKTENYNIIQQEDFEFDSAFAQHLIIIIFSLLPLFLIIAVWYFFGREHSYADVPNELTNIAKDRPGYEVAVAFNPPFTQNKNMFAAIMLELYNQKIIDFKTFENKTYIKLLKNTSKDEILNKFLKLIIKVQEVCKRGFYKGDYFNLKDAVEESGSKVYTAYESFSDDINKLQNIYLKKTGVHILAFLGIFLFFSFVFIGTTRGAAALSIFLFFMQSLIFIIIIIIMFNKSALFIQFKKEYYAEYLHWQSFKNYLKNSFAMRESGHEAAVLWGKYLVYAAAFGISKKLLKRLKDLKIINEEVYANYSTINTFAVSSFAFIPPSSSSGHSGFSGGGFSGAGGGGIGGGGGGGR